jgi:hypothetical protein
MLLKQAAANPTSAQPSVVVSNMSLDSGRKLVSYLINQAVTGLVHVAAVSSALYVFTQLLPEENVVLDNFVYDAQQPLETSEDGTLFKYALCKYAGSAANPTHVCKSSITIKFHVTGLGGGRSARGFTS